MQTAMVIRGRLVGPRNVELEESVGDMSPDVEVIVRPKVQATAEGPKDLIEFPRSVPSGGRTREDIDHQLAEERSAWGDR